MNADVRLNLDANGLGTVAVDGADLSSAVSGVECSGFAGAGTKVTLHLTAAALKDVTIKADTLEFKGSTIPSSVELALWMFLQAKFQPTPREIDVTSCDSLAREFTKDRD